MFGGTRDTTVDMTAPFETEDRPARTASSLRPPHEAAQAEGLGVGEPVGGGLAPPDPPASCVASSAARATSLCAALTSVWYRARFPALSASFAAVKCRCADWSRVWICCWRDPWPPPPPPPPPGGVTCPVSELVTAARRLLPSPTVPPFTTRTNLSSGIELVCSDRTYTGWT